MNPYVIALLFFVLCMGSVYEITAKKRSNLSAAIALILFAAAVAFRSMDTPDTAGYIEGFGLIETVSMRYGDFNIGFILLVCMFKALGLDVRYFFGFLALLNYGLAYYACKSLCGQLNPDGDGLLIRGKRMALTWRPCIFSALYIPYFGLFYSGIILRAGIAISMVLLSCPFLYRKKYAAAILLNLLAVLFHSSAVLGLLIFLCSRYPVRKQQSYISLWAGIVVIWTSHVSLLAVRLIPVVIHKLYETTHIASFGIYEAYYASSIRSDGFWGKKELFFLMIGAFFILNWSGNEIFQKLLTVLFAGIFLAFAIEYMTNSYRIVDFFLIFFVPCGCLHFMRKKRLNQMVVDLAGIMVMTAFQIIISVNIIGFH